MKLYYACKMYFTNFKYHLDHTRLVFLFVAAVGNKQSCNLKEHMDEILLIIKELSIMSIG